MPKLQAQKILIEGFKSFKEKQSFTFDGSGFTFITGLNGAGKSSLISSLIWTAYGKSLEGTKASITGNWAETNPCQGQFEFKLDGKDHYIYRAWNPNQLVLDDNNVTQDVIDKLLGVNYEGFLRAVVLAQAGESFIDEKPTEKLNIFCDILGLEFWQNCSKKASEKLKEVSTRLATINSKLESCSGAISSWRVILDNSTRDFSEFEIKKVVELEKLDKQLQEAKLQEKQLSLQINEYQVVVDKENQLYKNYGNKRSEFQVAVASAEDNYRKEEAKYTVNFNKKSQIEEKIVNLAKKSCPTCGRPLEASSINAMILEEEKKVQELGAIILSIKENLDTLSGKVLAAKKSLEEFDQKSINPPDYTKLLAVRNALNTQQQLTMGINASMKPYLGENPHKKQLDLATKELEKLNKIVVDLENEKTEVNKNIKSLEFWQDGFKELRLYIVDQALLEFEVEINYLLPQLGMKDWKVKLEVERENKSGTISKEFSVLVYPPDEDTPKDWSCWSAGQKQRLRIATSKGLMNLIKARTGLQVNFEAWDEPSVHLRPEAVIGFLEYLKECSADKQILLIDHNTPNYGDFTQVVNVVLDVAKGTILNISN